LNTIFREYDIRGIFQKELNEQIVKLIGYFFGKRVKGEKIVAVGFDARLHSPILRDYLVSGLNFAGCRVLDMGLVPTPLNYFSNYIDIEGKYKTNASIMITGSHNPKEYNGFKITLEKAPFFGKDIYSLGDEVLANIDLKIPTNTQKIDVDVKSSYIDFMVNEFKELKSLDKRIVIDCGNGVAGVVLPEIFNRLNLDYKALYIEPDGNFPNHHPDPSIEENLKDVKEALESSGDIAFAYDGDADRIAVLTHKYNIKGDQLAILFAKLMDRPTVIGEVKCSKIMYDELERMGAKAVMYKTGHSNLKVKMKELNADLACEVSGHIFFKHRYFGFDDALYATLRVLELLKEEIDIDKELDSLPKLYSTEEIKVKTTDTEKFKIVDKIKELLKNPPEYLPEIKNIIIVDGVRVEFDEGWGLVRASNTTPILVTRFEATTSELAQKYQDSIERLINEAKALLDGK
jgi:phosphomannomutase/phosphoglucomutase